MTFSYNITKTHPRPECIVIISSTMKNEKIDVNAIADTGADMTMIPDKIIEGLRPLIEGEMIHCTGIGGEVVIIHTYYVNLTIGSHYFPNCLVAVCPRNYAIIGRDILNQSKASFYANQNIWRLNCGGTCL